jgi:hypothetical protein
MTAPDHGSHGLDLLLRRTADDLALPDVDRLVAGGVARGRRTRRRRVRLGTAIAALSVAGVAGAGALVGPWPAAEAPQASFAEDTASPTPTPAPTSSESPTPAPSAGTVTLTAPGPLALRAQQIPGLVADLFPGTIGAAPERSGGIMDAGADTQIAHFLWNGTLMSVGALRGQMSAEAMCASADPGTVCTDRPDGSTLLTWAQKGPALDGGVTGRGVSLFVGGGWEIFAISYNAADGKDSPVLAPEPPLTHADLERVVSSERWFG